MKKLTASIVSSLAKKRPALPLTFGGATLIVLVLLLHGLRSQGVVSAQELQSPVSCQDNPVPNPLQVAALRWYSRNQVTRIPVPDGAISAMAFDGANMYVLNQSGIVKFRASDGAQLATFTDFGTLEVSSLTGPMAFDGAHLWVSLVASDAGWAEINAADGKFITSGGTPSNAFGGGVVFDGQNVWISNLTGGILKINPAVPSKSTFFPSPAPFGLAFDGNNIWIADQSGSAIVRRISDGAVVKTVALGGQLQAIAFDGANMWVTNVANSTVTKIRTHDDAILGTFPTQTTPGSIVFDGANIWIGNTGSKSITKLRACDGAQLGTFAAGGVPVSLAFDGINVWVPTANGEVGKM